MDHFIKAFLFILTVTCPLPVDAQQNLIKAIELNEIKFATIDRAGDIYVLTSSTLVKFDKNGKMLGETPVVKTVTAFDTGNGVRLLTYDRSLRQYTIFSPSPAKINEAFVDQSIAIDPVLVCSSGDYNILILDAADWSIKKADTREPRVISEFRIDSSLTNDAVFIAMREYQSFIFLLERKTGIYVFNSIGIKIKSLDIADLSSFNFLGQELYYLKDGRIHFFDLFTAETRSEELKGSFESVLISDERLIGIRSNRLEIYPYTPQ